MYEDSSSSSSDESSGDIYEFLSRLIRRNLLFSFKKYVYVLEVEPLKKLFLQTIRQEKKDFFDLLLNKLEIISHTGPDKEFYAECFKRSINCSVIYYIQKILQLNENLPAEKQCISLLSFTQHIEAVTVSTRTIPTNEYTYIATSPLLMAIKADNYLLVCMLLYYGAKTSNLPGDLTAFMWSIICKSAERIQRLLINYTATDPHDPFKGHIYRNYLYCGLLYGSPIVLDIIKQIPDIYGHDVVVLAVHLHVELDIFEKIWQVFDHDLWKAKQPISALMFLLRSTVYNKYFNYIQIALNNEVKLKLDIDYENSFELCPNYLISEFYLRLYGLGIDEETIQGLVLHLLSHGAIVHTWDVNRIYNKTKIFTPLLNFVISNVPLANTGFGYNNLMYFKYTPMPDIEMYIFNIPSDLLVESLTWLVTMYAFTNQLRSNILHKIDDITLYNECRLILERAETVPSILQLSRDIYREALCKLYDIKTSYQLHSVIREIDMPQYLQDLILFNKPLYP